MVKGRNEENSKIECLSCHKILVATNLNYYMNNNSLFKTERFPVCKECIREFIGDVKSSGFLDRFKLILALLNRPFLPEVLERKEGDWGTYLREISSLHQHKQLTFTNSEFLMGSKLGVEENDELIYDEEQIDDLVKYWGRGYTHEQLEYLEEEKMKLMSSFECPDYGMEMIMRDICFINLDIDNLRQEQKATSSKEIANLIKTRSDLMNDANMKPVQATGADANDQVTFGTLIKKWENDKPVPRLMDDEMKRYIDTFMVGHLAKMEGLNNELTAKYDEALSEYTIEFDEIKKADDFEDE